MGQTNVKQTKENIVKGCKNPFSILAYKCCTCENRFLDSPPNRIPANSYANSTFNAGNNRILVPALLKAN